MRTRANEQSPTPILDLLVPLPTQDSERITGKFAAPFLASVGMVAMTENYSLLTVLFGFLLINFLVTAVHESGHLVAGCCVGFRFKGVLISPFRIRLNSGCWQFSIRPRVFRGLAYMSLDRVRRIRRRLIVFVSGGPAASILVGALAAVGGEMGLSRYNSTVPAFLEFFGIWSFLIGCISLIPFRSGRYSSDGALLRALLFSRMGCSQLIAAYAISAIKSDDYFPPAYLRRWLRVSSVLTDTNRVSFQARWLAYEAADNADTEGNNLEACLRDSTEMDDDQRDKLIVEAACFHAWQRKDVHKANVWLSRLRFSDRLHWLSRQRAEVAILCGRGRFDEAIAILEKGLSRIRHTHALNERERVEQGWTTWIGQIRDRAITATNT
jgi:hypothetical protein